MKKNILKYSLIIFALFINAIAFAQDPDDFGGDPADTNPLDEPNVAPIGDYIWVLGLIAMVYVFYKMKKRIQSTN